MKKPNYIAETPIVLKDEGVRFGIKFEDSDFNIAEIEKKFRTNKQNEHYATLFASAPDLAEALNEFLVYFADQNTTWLAKISSQRLIDLQLKAKDALIKAGYTE